MCSGSEAGSYSRLIDFVYHSTICLIVKEKKKGVPLTISKYSLRSMLRLFLLPFCCLIEGFKFETDHSENSYIESCTVRHSSQFKNNCFTEMRSGSEEGSCLRLTDGCITQL